MAYQTRKEIEKSMAGIKRRTGGSIDRAGKIKLFLALFAVFVFILGIIYMILLERSIVDEVTVEAGNLPAEEELKVYSFDKRDYVLELNGEDLTEPGDHNIIVNTGLEYPVLVHVKDTVPPVAEAVDVVAKYGRQVSAEEFVKNINDVTKCSVKFVKEPDMSLYSWQEVEVIVSDTSGNSITLSSGLYIPNLRAYYIVEAGDEPPKPESLCVNPGSSAKYLEDVEALKERLSSPGIYNVPMEVDGIEMTVTFNSVDTTPPKVTLKEVTRYLNKPVEVEEFIESYEDVSNVTFSFEPYPAIFETGTRPVYIRAVDSYGNNTVCKGIFTVIKDTVAPKIAVGDIIVKTGTELVYENYVVYSDDIDLSSEMELEIDAKNVDIDRQGAYVVTYRVYDHSGNSSTGMASVNVYNEAPEWYDETSLNIKTDKIIKEITNDGMSQKDIAAVVYKYVNKTLKYKKSLLMGDENRAVYEGINNAGGNSYVYASLSKKLFERAGMEALIVTRENAEDIYFWNMVKVGNRWYHFDAVPHKDKTEWCLATQGEVDAYSMENASYYYYDKSRYPESL
ncbi:MAG: hypothetical protein K6B75_08675 [Lachnospiraceae bacterium]|nr:hypothetical protein [Lachnospiraceae bacterium]